MLDKAILCRKKKKKKRKEKKARYKTETALRKKETKQKQKKTKNEGGKVGSWSRRDVYLKPEQLLGLHKPHPEAESI